MPSFVDVWIPGSYDRIGSTESGRFDIILSLRSKTKWKFSLTRLGKCIVLFVASGFLMELFPQLMAVWTWIAAQMGAWANRWHETNIQFGPTAIGLNVFLFIIAWAIFGFTRKSWKRQLFFLAVVSLGSLLALPIVFYNAVESSVFQIAVRVSAYWGAWLALFIGIGTMLEKPESNVNCPPTNWKRASSLFGLSMVVGLTVANVAICFQNSDRRIVVHNRGGLDWHRSTYEEQGGMFGALPSYSRAYGFELGIINKDLIDTGDLDEAQVLVLINSGKEWLPEEVDTIYQFVEEGGSVLVLGDHTDVFGLMKSFNQLLEPVKVGFKFDSAYHARKGWRGCFTTACGCVESRWEQYHPGVAIGASLTLAGFSRPLVQGSFGHSDLGLRQNTVGSYLGNYRFDDHEAIGDLNLIALAPYGKGRIVVFGDTSTFQGGLSGSFQKNIGPLFEFLCRQPGITEAVWWRMVVSILALGLILILSFLSPTYLMLVATGLLIGLGTGQISGSLVLDKATVADQQTVLLGECQLNRVGHYEAGGNSIGPLYVNLSRSGFRLEPMKRWSKQLLNNSRAIAFVAPQKRFGQSQVDDLLSFEREGGVVILAAGYPDSVASSQLLRLHDLECINSPMGTVELGPNSLQRKTNPRFLDAWPVRSTKGSLMERDEIDVLFQHEGEAIAVFCRKAKGGLLYFADSRFFSSRNIEDFPYSKWEGNVTFVRQLFERYLDAKPENVRPAFPSPEKPQ